MMIRTESMMLYKVDISLSYGQLQPTVEWCERNCNGDWELIDTNTGYSFLFSDDKDYVAFLIWNK